MVRPSARLSPCVSNGQAVNNYPSASAFIPILSVSCISEWTNPLTKGG
jgi:hypothetical protein